MKAKRLFFLLLVTCYLLLVTSSVWAIFEERPAHARAWGMGGAFTAVADDSSAIYFNPAGLGQLEMMELSFTYTMLYKEKNLEYMLGSLALPMGKLGTIGLSANKYGHGKIIEDSYIFSAGRKFIFENHDIYLGGNAKALHLEIETVDTEFDYGGDLGLLYKVLDGKLTLGLFGGNVNTPHIGEDLPQRYAGGIAYRPSPDLTFAIDYHHEIQEEEEEDEFRFGLEYHWLKHLFFRSGVANNPGRWTVGLGLRNRFLSFDYAYLSHHNLAATHLSTLTFRFGGPKKAKPEEEVAPSIEPEKVIEKPEEVPTPEERIEVPVQPEVPEVIEKIDINTASRSQLQTLPGIGPVGAFVIIAHRPFESIEDIQRVPGIGPQAYEKIKDLIIIKAEEIEKLEEVKPLEIIPVPEAGVEIPVKPEKVIEKAEEMPIPEEEVKIPTEVEEKPYEARVLILPPEEPHLAEEKPLAPEVLPEEVVPVKVEEVSRPVIKEITHIVVKGDTLSEIAERYLGNAWKYREIAEYNGIKDLDFIRPGKVLKILIEVKE